MQPPPTLFFLSPLLLKRRDCDLEKMRAREGEEEEEEDMSMMMLVRTRAIKGEDEKEEVEVDASSSSTSGQILSSSSSPSHPTLLWCHESSLLVVSLIFFVGSVFFLYVCVRESC